MTNVQGIEQRGGAGFGVQQDQGRAFARLMNSHDQAVTCFIGESGFGQENAPPFFANQMIGIVKRDTSAVHIDQVRTVSGDVGDLRIVRCGHCHLGQISGC